QFSTRHSELLYDFEADDQRHRLRHLDQRGEIVAFVGALRGSDIYIADGHHRYETALAYRDEVRDGSDHWTGEEPENFVLMALTQYADPGLLVLPTHRIVHVAPSRQVLEAIQEDFQVEPLPEVMKDDARFASALDRLTARSDETI